jgi:hypothetical protein
MNLLILPKGASRTAPVSVKAEAKPAAAQDAIISNPIDGKTKLTRAEALDAITKLSAVLYVDEMSGKPR